MAKHCEINVLLLIGLSGTKYSCTKENCTENYSTKLTTKILYPQHGKSFHFSKSDHFTNFKRNHVNL